MTGKPGAWVLTAAALAACGSGGGKSDVGAVVDSGVMVAPSESSYATPGGTIHMPCYGSGAVPVVFIAGGADPPTVWEDMIALLGPNVLTCTFDRPGVAPSYVPSVPLTPQLVADALADTLPLAHLGSRFVFVGHSLAGIHLRVFGASHADLISGVVFVDPTVPSVDTSEAAVAYIAWVNGQLASFGFDAPVTESEGAAVTSWQSNASITVLSHDPALAVSSGAFTASAEAVWDEGQKVYARLTSNGTQSFVEGATHYVFRSNPALVAAAIDGLVRDAR